MNNLHSEVDTAGWVVAGFHVPIQYLYTLPNRLRGLFGESIANRAENMNIQLDNVSHNTDKLFSCLAS